MSNISRLTSKKTKILYILSYSVYSLLFWANPILIMKFVDNVVLRDWNMMLIYGISTLVMFILIQLVCYIFSYFVGKLEMENYSNYFQKLSDLVTYQDLENGEINNASLNQYLGQYYQSASDFFLKRRLSLFFLLLILLLFLRLCLL